MLEELPSSRSGSHAAPGDDVRSLRYCRPASLQFPGAGRGPPACRLPLRCEDGEEVSARSPRLPERVMTASLSRNFNDPLRLRLPKQLLHLRRNERW